MASTVLPLAPGSKRRASQIAGQASALVMLLLTGSAGCDAGPAAGTPSHGALRDANSLRGQRLLAQYQCGSCHAIPGVAAARGIRGPSLEAFGRRSYIAGHIPNRPDALVRWIMQPSALVPGTLMPSMGVSPSDARDMAAYLGALQ